MWVDVCNAEVQRTVKLAAYMNNGWHSEEELRSLRTPHRHCQWKGKVVKGREQRCSLFLCPSDGIGIGRTPLFDHRHVYEKTLNGRRVSKGFILPHCRDQ